MAVLQAEWTWECHGTEHEVMEVPPGTVGLRGFPDAVLDVVVYRRSDGLILYSDRLFWADFEEGPFVIVVVP